ncbi:peptidoglycan recognition protein family protein [Streptomyces halobius]|uniref:N-acetylmuramoyl-L-alanine amidase n=1 Tax=Streptomyces halobius TaxID=2879846 RepID=A0ABY4M5K8_9ACTN|nr:N-acetylmuramoyl-L-alanine amidase [Streptomyces halobius]UQA91645.1 N-acetylmuramoyl-L-alanine amidase [Streptomyces halobius]
MADPLSASRLKATLVREGCSVREYRDWETHRRPPSTGAFGPINGVMMHHTVTGPGTDVVALIYNGHSSLPGPLSQGCITKSGTVWLTSAGRSNHAGLGDSDVLRAVINESYGDYPPPDNQANTDGNARFYGFECENLGDGEDPWPRVQYVAMVKAAAAVLREYGWTAKSVIAHKEWQPGKVDPRGIDMKTFRRDVAACLALPAGSWGPEQEDSMAITNADADKIATAVLNRDGLIVIPGAPADNPTYTTKYAFTEILKRVDALTAKVDALETTGLTDTQMQAVAEKVADVLAARMES